MEHTIDETRTVSVATTGPLSAEAAAAAAGAAARGDAGEFAGEALLPGKARAMTTLFTEAS